MICNNDIVLYTFLGIASIILLFSLNKWLQTNNQEGFTTSTDKNNISDVVKNAANKLSDVILISKYRSAYEDTIINLENVVGLAMLNETINNAETISQDPVSKESIEAIATINNLKQFKETLNDVMITLDKSK
jgi:hypothetical protein